MWEIAVHLAVACGVYGDVFFVLSFFPRGVLDEILNVIESVSEDFPSYSLNRFYGAPTFTLIFRRGINLKNKNKSYIDTKHLFLPIFHFLSQNISGSKEGSYKGGHIASTHKKK